MGQEDGAREKEMKHVWNSILCGRAEDRWRAQTEHEHASSHLAPHNPFPRRTKAKLGKCLGNRWKQGSSSTGECRNLAFFTSDL